jgi:subtilisin-like proprotein convertase family protein
MNYIFSAIQSSKFKVQGSRFKVPFLPLSRITLLALLTLATLPLQLRAASPAIFSINATIPDGDLNGYQNSQTMSGLQPYITDVNVTLTISGGFNGDFYAYLSHGNQIAILLNRVGRGSASSVGYPDAGFGPDNSANSFTFDDQASHDLHLYRTFSYSLNGSGQLTGAWQPDGRNIDPLSSGSLFDSASRTAPLSVFNTLDPNGSWTLFISDVSSGGEGTLVNWGLQITAVPEPTAAALLLTGLAGGVWSLRTKRRRLG